MAEKKVNTLNFSKLFILGAGTSSQKEDIPIEENLRTNLLEIYMEKKYTDVELVVEGTTFSVHRLILAVQSKYFEILLLGNFSEVKQESIALTEVKLKPFKVLLHYMYSGKLIFNTKDAYDVLDVLNLAYFLQLDAVINAIKKYMKGLEPDTHNIIPFFNSALMYNDVTLKTTFMNAINLKAQEILKHDAFNTFSEDALIALLENDNFSAPEIDIFLAAVGWIKNNPDINPNTILSRMRLTMISNKDLLTIVRPKGYLSDDKILDAILRKEDHLDLCRFQLKPPRSGTFIHGTRTQNLLDPMESLNGMTKEQCAVNNSNIGITLKLNESCWVGRIELVLPDVFNINLDVALDITCFENVFSKINFNKNVLVCNFAPRFINYVRVRGPTICITEQTDQIYLCRLHVYSLD